MLHSRAALYLYSSFQIYVLIIYSINPPCPPFFKGGNFSPAEVFAVNRLIFLLVAIIGSPFVKGDRGDFSVSGFYRPAEYIYYNSQNAVQ